MIIQDRLKKLMEERNWTEYKLARMSGLSQSTISNLFRRNNSPTLPTLEAVCRAFDITLSQFFAEDGDVARISEEQELLFAKWSTLSPERKKTVLELLDYLRQ